MYLLVSKKLFHCHCHCQCHCHCHMNSTELLIKNGNKKSCVIALRNKIEWLLSLLVVHVQCKRQG